MGNRRKKEERCKQVRGREKEIEGGKKEKERKKEEYNYGKKKNVQKGAESKGHECGIEKKKG